MLNNWINIHDVVTAREKISQIGFQNLFHKLIGTPNEKIITSWSHTSSVTSHWWDIPEIEQRCNKLITGSPSVSQYEYVSKKYFKKKKLNGISLGCGAGNKEIKWVSACKNLTLSGYDISPERIDQAKQSAELLGLQKRLFFETADVNSMSFPENSLDVIIIEGALHHFFNVRTLLKKLNTTLTKDGYIIVNDYVGPARFQWTERQIEAANGVLNILPLKYRKRVYKETIKKMVYRPGRLSMTLNDPSESVESDQITPNIENIFKILEKKEYGGTMLQILFKDIAHNFLDGTESTKEYLEMIFQIEDLLMKSGELKSDFVFFVGKRK